MSTEKDPKTITPPEPPPTPEELAEQAKATGEMFFSNKAPDAKPKKEAEKSKEPPKEEKKPDEPPKPEAEKKPDEPRKPKKSARANIIDRIGRLEESVRETIPPEDDTEPTKTETKPKEIEPETPKAETTDLSLTDEEQDHLDALAVLERNPKHKGAVAKVRDFWSKLDAYQTRWEARNPGEKFKPDDADHADFFSNEPQFAENDLRVARRTVRQEQIENATKSAVDKVRKEEIDPALGEFKRDKAMRDHAPHIAAAAQKRAATLCALVSHEFEKIVTTDKGPVLTQEAIAKMESEDPELFEIVNEHAEPVEVMIKEIEKVTRMPQHFRFDPSLRVSLTDGRSFRPHQQIMDAWESLEAMLTALPAEKQVWDGKKFMRGAEFQKRWAEGNATAREKLQRGFWTPSPDDLSDFIVQEESRKIKKAVARANLMLETRAKKNGAKTEKPDKTKDEVKPDETPPPRSATTTSSSDLQDNSLRTGDEGEENAKKTHEMFFS